MKYSTILQIEIITDEPDQDSEELTRNLEEWGGGGLNIVSVIQENKSISLKEVKSKDKFGYYSDEY